MGQYSCPSTAGKYACVGCPPFACRHNSYHPHPTTHSYYRYTCSPTPLHLHPCLFLLLAARLPPPPMTHSHTHTHTQIIHTLKLIDLSQCECILTFRGRCLKSLLPPQTHSQSQTQPRVLQECRQTRTHRAASGPILTTRTHTPNRLRGCRRQGLHTHKYTYKHTYFLCVLPTLMS